MRRLLLDTNVVIWLLLSAHDSITETATEVLTDNHNLILVSAASIWEIAIKRSQGKLEIEEHWFERLLELTFESLPIGYLHARKVEDLSLLHRDPFDRLLIAQALVEEVPVVTSDSRFQDYGVEVIW